MKTLRFASLASLLVGLAALAGAAWDVSQPLNGISFQRIKAVQAPTPDRPSMKFSRLRNVKGKPGVLTTTSALGRVLRTPPLHHQHTYQNVSTAGDFSTQYAIQCGWDGVPLWLLFDTGSSDTWTVQTGFECNGGGRYEQSACGFGPTTVDGFKDGPIDDLHFLLRYGSGEKVHGPMGYSDIACGGVHVSRQQVGLANYTLWHGNNLTVGILGLAYPSLTSAFYGPIGTEAPWNAITYTPFLTKAIMQGTIDPVFSVAILKNSSEGMLAWGGLPPMERPRGSFAATDLIIDKANLIGQSETSWRYSFYTIIPDGVKWGQSTDTTKFPYIVDTGTTMNYLPPPLAEAIAMAFQPRAVFMYQWGSYFAPCHAIPPHFAIIISGVEFWINPADLIYQDLKDPLTGYCAVAIASGGSGPYILGDVFLQNVVAVFDVGAAQMRFYARE
ncbi:eukaryotic aspartyl protease [Drechmeria coniospora]|uniref:Eukaryotic aspartyl protease n=1 Tax=Drechmeria coniospora TaxID=98403 RepID=A0A151GMV7_DRECN|nr:eukaryotic aspartyl protease [Drechmeria coniospora]KYK58439.1 eukaryotic aspartyl protease [Drechmeria coniospora]